MSNPVIGKTSSENSNKPIRKNNEMQDVKPRTIFSAVIPSKLAPEEASRPDGILHGAPVTQHSTLLTLKRVRASSTRRQVVHDVVVHIEPHAGIVVEARRPQLRCRRHGEGVLPVVGLGLGRGALSTPDALPERCDGNKQTLFCAT
jgi:hypothetical protein